MSRSLYEKSGETCRRGEDGRSQSLHSTEAAKAARGAESKAAPREGRQEGGSVNDGTKQTQAAEVPEMAIQAADPPDRDWSWVEASVWTERMLAALDNGVKGGKWFSLMDKATRPTTLAAAWRKVASNGGAAGVDRQSIGRFAAKSDEYLGELARSLDERSYQPQPVRRVEIPKGDGKTRPLGSMPIIIVELPRKNRTPSHPHAKR